MFDCDRSFSSASTHFQPQPLTLIAYTYFEQLQVIPRPFTAVFERYRLHSTATTLFRVLLRVFDEYQLISSVNICFDHYRAILHG